MRNKPGRKSYGDDNMHDKMLPPALPLRGVKRPRGNRLHSSREMPNSECALPELDVKEDVHHWPETRQGSGCEWDSGSGWGVDGERMGSG